MQTIYCYNDEWEWGKLLYDVVKRQDQVAYLFRKFEEVTDAGYVFMHLAHAPPAQRSYDKQLAERLAERDGVTIIPSLLECRLYDDKLLQTQLLSQWMPETFASYSAGDAYAAIDNLCLPFVSKSRSGASGVNVRLIETRSMASQEIDAAFESEGLPIYNDQRQSGYLIWQELIDTKTDWRVMLIAQRYGMVILRRNHFSELPADFPESFYWKESKTYEVYTNQQHLDEECTALLEFMYGIASSYDLGFQMADVIRTPGGSLRLLETGSGFGLSPGHDDFVFFERVNGRWQSCDYRQCDFFEIIATCVLEKSFKANAI